MKEKELDKHLDNIIIAGLIKEAEQDNADFEAAMRRLSFDELEELLYDPAFVSSDDTYDSFDYISTPNLHSFNEDFTSAHESVQRSKLHFEKGQCIDIVNSNYSPYPSYHSNSRRKHLTPWIVAIGTAIAIIVAVLIPSMHAMDARLCESALYTGVAYTVPLDSGIPVAESSVEEIKRFLPTLERKYRESIIVDGKLTQYTDDFQQAGWTLTLAYLKLHKKSDAVKVLKTLEQRYSGSEFGAHCRRLLQQLD